MSDRILEVKDLNVNFEINQNKKWPWSAPQQLHAVNGISFALEKGKTLGVVGESGCGKSTLIRAIAGLYPPTSGQVTLAGQEIDYKNRDHRQLLQSQIQMIFQDPIASLNPRMTVQEIIHEPVAKFFPTLSQDERQQKIYSMLDRVGIARRNLGRFPHEFSGGQCQRIGIARALISEPQILLCDEPVSALDVSIQAQVVNLLIDLQKEMGLSMIFVAHDLGVVRYISDDILVMYLGGLMEMGHADILVDAPQHPYTQALLSAVPSPDPHVQLQPQFLDGDLPSPMALPEGCLFSTRCPKADDNCRQTRPDIFDKYQRKISCLKV